MIFMSSISSPVLNVLMQVVDGECVTRRRFHEKITSAIKCLKLKGMVPNDRVIITMQPSVDFYAIAFAVLAIGKFYFIIRIPHVFL